MSSPSMLVFVLVDANLQAISRVSQISFMVICRTVSVGFRNTLGFRNCSCLQIRQVLTLCLNKNEGRNNLLTPLYIVSRG